MRIKRMKTKAIGLAMLVPLAVAAAACSSSGGSSGSASKTLVFATPGPGAYTNAEIAAWVKPFEAKTGAKITITTFNDAQLAAQVQSNDVSWDVIDTVPYFPNQYCGKYVQKIKITGVQGKLAAGTVSQCGAPILLDGTLMMYNSKTYKNDPPQTVEDFFNTKKYPGKRIIPNEPYSGLYEFALLADGVPQSQLYPLDTTKALDKFDTIKSDLQVASSNSQVQQVMDNDQADMAIVVTSRAYSVLTSGGTFWKVMPTDKTITPEDLSVPVDAPNAALAKQFIAFAEQPAQQTKMADLSAAVGPVNLAATPVYPKLGAEVNPFQPGQKQTLIYLNVNYWSKNYNTLENTFENWISQ